MEQEKLIPENSIEDGKDSEKTILSDQLTKTCAYCKQEKPLADFLRRTGKRSGPSSRRGACKACRKKRKLGGASPAKDPFAQSERADGPAPASVVSGCSADLSNPPDAPAKVRTKRPLPPAPPRPEGPDASTLRATREGIVRMRGRTDKGKRWQQETDLETAVILVREHAAVVVNRHTVRRIYTNKSFRTYILTRDQYTCHFCGEYGDTIDHLLPRAKGGHTTPVNCVCACNECNQMKADRSINEFFERNE